MSKKFLQRMLSPILRSEGVVKLNQQSALKRVDAIEKGKIKALAPKFPTTAKLQKDVDEENKIKKILDAKDDSLIDKINKIDITSTHPPDPPAHGAYVKKEEYSRQDLIEHEYGFFELPLERMAKNKLMFREALEILRARMELMSNKSPQDLPFFEEHNDYLDNHPAVQRVDRGKLENVWQYFRPFALIREQMLLRKEDLEMIDRYIEGSDESMTPYRLELRKRVKQLEASGATPASRVGNSKAHQEEFDAILRDRHEKEKERLQKRLEELKELDQETRKSRKG